MALYLLPLLFKAVLLINVSSQIGVFLIQFTLSGKNISCYSCYIGNITYCSHRNGREHDVPLLKRVSLRRHSCKERHVLDARPLEEVQTCSNTLRKQSPSSDLCRVWHGATSAALFPSGSNKLTLAVRCRTARTSASPCAAWRVSLCVLQLLQVPLSCRTEWQRQHTPDTRGWHWNNTWSMLMRCCDLWPFHSCRRTAVARSNTEPGLSGITMQGSKGERKNIHKLVMLNKKKKLLALIYMKGQFII